MALDNSDKQVINSLYSDAARCWVILSEYLTKSAKKSKDLQTKNDCLLLTNWSCERPQLQISDDKEVPYSDLYLQP